MKYRIIQRGDGKFLVQEKVGFFSWRNIYVRRDDFPDDINSTTYDYDWINGVYPTIEIAKAKIQKLVDEKKAEQMKKQFKVIEEVEV